MMQKTNQYRSLALGLILAGFPFHVATAQQEPNEADVAYVRTIFDKVLSQSSCYQWLDHLSLSINGARSLHPYGLRPIMFLPTLSITCYQALLKAR